MPSSTICVDASLVVQLVTGGTLVHRIAPLWSRWHEEGRLLVAPTLLYYEVANALHRYLVSGFITPEEERDAFEAALEMGIVLLGDASLHRRALQIAQDLNLSAAYDAHYLALAEQFGAEFWTADQRLANNVGSRLPWVRLVSP